MEAPISRSSASEVDPSALAVRHLHSLFACTDLFNISWEDTVLTGSNWSPALSWQQRHPTSLRFTIWDSIDSMVCPPKSDTAIPQKGLISNPSKPGGFLGFSKRQNDEIVIIQFEPNTGAAIGVQQTYHVNMWIVIHFRWLLRNLGETSGVKSLKQNAPARCCKFLTSETKQTWPTWWDWQSLTFVVVMTWSYRTVQSTNRL